MRPSRVAIIIIASLTAAACARYRPVTYATSYAAPQSYSAPAGYGTPQPYAPPQAYAAPPQYAAAPMSLPSDTAATSAITTPVEMSEAPPVVYAGTAAAQTAPAAVSAYDQTYAWSAPDAANAPYTIDSGDRVRVIVYGQEGLNNSYTVDAAGQIMLPLGGAVYARGLTKAQLTRAVVDRLAGGYIREPHVAVEIETYRPFFILGEVNAPGQYPYAPNLTIENAVAVAGGFTPRADRRKIVVTRNVGGQAFRGVLPPGTPLRPGDNIQVEERWF